MPLALGSTTSAPACPRRDAGRCWSKTCRRKIQTKTHTQNRHPSALPWPSLFPHSFFIPVVEAPQSSSPWDTQHMAKILSPQVYHQQGLHLQPAQSGWRKHLYKLLPPPLFRQVICIYTLHMSLISLFACTCAQTATLFWAGHHNSSSINSHLGKREPNYSYCFLFPLVIKERKPEILL